MIEPHPQPGSYEASAPGKLVILGEYVVLEGAPAIVAAIDRRAVATYVPQLGPRHIKSTWTIISPTLALQVELVASGGSDNKLLPVAGQTVPKALHLAHAMLVAVHAVYGDHLVPGALTLDTQAFFIDGQKLGLGSSAAISVAAWHALTACACAHAGSAMPNAWEAIRAVQAVHRTAQGELGSGVDVVTSTLGGILRFARGRPQGPPSDPACEDEAIAAALEGRARGIAPVGASHDTASFLSALPGMRLMAIWTGKAAVTSNFLRAFAQLKQNDAASYWQHCERLAALSHAGSELWHLGHADGLKPIFAQYHAAMAALGEKLGEPVVSDVHCRATELAARVGCSYKPSGAGGGDVGLALCRGWWQWLKLRLAARNAGFVYLPLKWGVPGVAVYRRAVDK